MQVLRISRGRVRPGTWDQYEAALQRAVEAAGHVPGLVSRSLVRSVSDPDEGYTISVWESQAAVENYENGDLAKVVNPIVQPFFTGDYRTDHCEVRYWEVKT